MILTFAASVGFVLAITTFIAGFRMIRLSEQKEENLMHRVNGYLTVCAFIAVASLSMTVNGFSLSLLLLWGGGFGLHLGKLLLVRKKLAVRYGGYLGVLLMMTWMTIIFNHLPE